MDTAPGEGKRAELMKTKGKRVVFIDEPEPEPDFMGYNTPRFMIEFSGSDRYYRRNRYGPVKPKKKK